MYTNSELTDIYGEALLNADAARRFVLYEYIKKNTWRDFPIAKFPGHIPL
jgi:hypothetical protein